MEKDLLLVQLPVLPGHKESFYGLGYYSSKSEFNFVLITEEIYDLLPSRILQSNNKPLVLSKIKNSEYEPIKKKSKRGLLNSLVKK